MGCSMNELTAVRRGAAWDLLMRFLAGFTSQIPVHGSHPTTAVALVLDEAKTARWSPASPALAKPLLSHATPAVSQASWGLKSAVVLRREVSDFIAISDAISVPHGFTPDHHAATRGSSMDQSRLCAGVLVCLEAHVRPCEQGVDVRRLHGSLRSDARDTTSS